VLRLTGGPNQNCESVRNFLAAGSLIGFLDPTAGKFLRILKGNRKREKWRVEKEANVRYCSAGPWRSRFIYSLNLSFLLKNRISFSAINSRINGRLPYLDSAQ
jgi:hypothetical protein